MISFVVMAAPTSLRATGDCIARVAMSSSTALIELCMAFVLSPLPRSRQALGLGVCVSAYPSNLRYRRANPVLCSHRSTGKLACASSAAGYLIQGAVA
jgi:hypothetical protein